MWSPNGPSSRSGSRGIDVAFDDEVGVGGHFEVVGFALDEFDGFFAEITGEQKFVEAVGQRRGGGKGEHGIAAEEDGDGHARAGFVVAAAVARADFLELPVHAGGAVVVNLDAIHADVALAGVGVLRDDAGQGDEASAVERPAFEDGKIEQGRGLSVRGSKDPSNPARAASSSALGAGFSNLWIDFLARAVLDELRFGVAQVEARCRAALTPRENWSAAWLSRARRVRPRLRPRTSRPCSWPCVSRSPSC